MMEVVQAHMQLFGQVRLARVKGVIVIFWSCQTPAAPAERLLELQSNTFPPATVQSSLYPGL